MRTHLLLPPLLLLSSFLRLGTAAAQAPPEAETQINGPILVEPDSITRHLFARTRVRSVVKIRLNGEGELRDTVAYQEIDPLGRALRADIYLSPQRRRQWSYDAQGRCTSVVAHPTASQPYTYIYSYNPSLRRGAQQMVRPNGNSITLNEIELQQRGDTLFSENQLHGIVVGNSTFVKRESRHRSLGFTPHPDTTLVLNYAYNTLGKLESATISYRLSRRGQLLEIGHFDMPKVAKLYRVKPAPGLTVPVLTAAQALAALRRGQGLRYQHRWFYNAQGRVERQETRTPLAQDGQFAITTTQFSYDAQGMLLSRAHTTQSLYSPPKTAYSVYSYSPTGLLLGETSDARSEKPTFYRYQYSYYE